MAVGRLAPHWKGGAYSIRSLNVKQSLISSCQSRVNCQTLCFHLLNSYIILLSHVDPSLRRKSRRHSGAARSEQSSAPDLRSLSNGSSSSTLADKLVIEEQQQLSKQMSNSSPELDMKARRRQLRRYCSER